MKKHKLKPRYIFLAISLTVMIFGYLIYAVIIGQSYNIYETTGMSPFDLSSIKVASSNENVIKATDVTQNFRDDGMNLLKISTKSINPGSCKISYSYYSGDEKYKESRELVVLPFGLIYDLTFNSFTAIYLALPFEIGLLLLFIIVLSISFTEKLKQGNFSYSMAVLGGQGSNEVISEAESMKRCLMEMGVPEERILKEDKSVNTYQNIAFSKTVIEQDHDKKGDVNIAFSTTNYHVFRGYTLAKKSESLLKVFPRKQSCISSLMRLSESSSGCCGSRSFAI